MTDLHLGSSSKYQPKNLVDRIKASPIIGGNKISRVFLHCRNPINTGIFFSIHQLNHFRREAIKIHLIVLDDLDFRHGCSDQILIKIFENLIDVAKLNEKITIICSDFINRSEFLEQAGATRRIRNLKIDFDRLEDKHPDIFAYFDHEEYCEYERYRDPNLTGTSDLELTIRAIIKDIEEAPSKSFPNK
jgi:hypothetical protein